jgi:hypothetical protein
VKIELTGEIEVEAMLSHMSTLQTGPSPNQAQTIQTLNVLLGHYPRASPTISTIASNSHFPLKAAGIDLGGGLSALRGYFRSVHTTTLSLTRSSARGLKKLPIRSPIPPIPSRT